MAARRCAVEILSGVSATGWPRCGALLILTAACLHLGSRIGPQPTLADVQVFLRTLATPPCPAWRLLADSPLQFLQFVAAEFESCVGTADEPLDLAIAAVTTQMDLSCHKSANSTNTAIKVLDAVNAPARG